MSRESPFIVTVEAVSSVNEFMGGSGSGTVETEEAVQPGDTLRDLLRRLGERHPQLGTALWDPATGGLGTHLEVAVNGAILGISHDLDSPLQAGDRVMLMGQYVGG